MNKPISNKLFSKSRKKEERHRIHDNSKMDQLPIAGNNYNKTGEKKKKK